MFGKNLKRSILPGDGSLLEVKNIFKTIQGEGPFVGEPAVFIRLGGCNLACSFCDTDFENFITQPVTEVAQQVDKFSKNAEGTRSIKLVVITGGEPLRQPITKLCQALIALKFKVQIETNGTIYRALPQQVHIICSPKPGINGYGKIHPELLKNISALKFIVAKNLPNYHNYSELGQTKYNIPVFIQPMDQNDQTLNQENTSHAIKLALETGSRISLQIHKFLNIE